MNVVMFPIMVLGGVLAGWLAGFVMERGGYGLKGDIVLGLAGSAVGSWIFWALGASPGAMPVAVILARPGGYLSRPGRSRPGGIPNAPERRACGRLRGLREVAHHGIQVGPGLSRERLVKALVQLLERQPAVGKVLTQLSGDRFTIGVPDAHVEFRSHRALRSKNGESPST